MAGWEAMIRGEKRYREDKFLLTIGEVGIEKSQFARGLKIFST